MSKSSKFYSIFNYKCPKCHKGDLYYTSTLSFRRIFDMREKCPLCGQKYVLETGFYWGAMYIAYMLSSGLMFSLFLLFYFVFNLNLIWSFAGIIVVAIFMYGLIFRTARSIWINIFVHYDEKISAALPE